MRTKRIVTLRRIDVCNFGNAELLHTILVRTSDFSESRGEFQLGRTLNTKRLKRRMILHGNLPTTDEFCGAG